jgi:hypothetical protein
MQQNTTYSTILIDTIIFKIIEKNLSAKETLQYLVALRNKLNDKQNEVRKKR